MSDDLAEFLLARIGDDEAVARDAQRNMRALPAGATIFHRADLAHIARWDPARVLAECEAKRRIVAELRLAATHAGAEYDDGRADAFSAALLLLALPYADHPAYDSAWRP